MDEQGFDLGHLSNLGREHYAEILKELPARKEKVTENLRGRKEQKDREKHNHHSEARCLTEMRKEAARWY